MAPINCSGCSGGTRYSLTAAAHQFAIEGDVVVRADDDDLGARVADLGQTIELGQEARAVVEAFDDDQGRGRLVLVLGHGRGQAAGPNLG